MHVLTSSPSKAVEAASRLLLNHGTETSPRGQKTLECLNVTIEIRQPWLLPLDLDGRNLNQAIGAAEAAQLIGQVTLPERMIDITHVFTSFTDGGIFHGAYGPRIAGGLSQIHDLLHRDPDSRQAVLSVYQQHRDLNTGARDIPCTLTLQFFVRDSKLLLRTSMRSNDAWLGLPYDLTQFCALQGAMAAALDLPMGTYTHTVGSLHLYEQHWERARHITAQDEVTEYTPLFTNDFISGISRFCRNALIGTSDPFTPFEKFLAQHAGPRS